MTDQKCLSDLDFHRLIDLVLGYAVNPLGQEHVKTLQPSTESGELAEKLETVFEMRSILESGDEDFSLDLNPLGDEFRLLKVEHAFLDGLALKKIEKMLWCARCLKESSYSRGTR